MAKRKSFRLPASLWGWRPENAKTSCALLEQVGGQDALAALLIASAEFPAELFQAAFSCQFQMGGPPAGLGTAGAPGSPIGVSEARPSRPPRKLANLWGIRNIQ